MTTQPVLDREIASGVGGGGGGHRDPEIREVPGLERIFSPLQASVWSKIRRAPPLDPPLKTPATVSIERMPADHLLLYWWSEYILKYDLF